MDFEAHLLAATCHAPRVDAGQERQDVPFSPAVQALPLPIPLIPRKVPTHTHQLNDFHYYCVIILCYCEHSFPDRDGYEISLLLFFASNSDIDITLHHRP